MTTSLALRIEKFAVYIIIIYMATMSGLYFHMDSRINVLQTMQSETFKKYSLKEEKHDAEVSEIRNNFVDLDSSVKSLRDEVKEHLNGLTNLLVNNSILIKNNHIDTVEELKVNKAAANKSKKTPESR